MTRSAGVRDVLQAVVDWLRSEGGLSADLDPAKVNLPGVWVAVGPIAPDLLDGNGHVTPLLYLVVPDGLAPDVLTMLDRLLGDVLALVDVEGDVRPQSVIMPDGPGTKPAYLVTMAGQPYQRTET